MWSSHASDVHWTLLGTVCSTYIILQVYNYSYTFVLAHFRATNMKPVKNFDIVVK